MHVDLWNDKKPEGAVPHLIYFGKTRAPKPPPPPPYSAPVQLCWRIMRNLVYVAKQFLFYSIQSQFLQSKKQESQIVNKKNEIKLKINQFCSCHAKI